MIPYESFYGVANSANFVAFAGSGVNALLHVYTATKIAILYVLIRFVFTSSMILARLKYSKFSVYEVDS